MRVSKLVLGLLAVSGLSGCSLFDNSTGFEPVSLTQYAPTVTPKIVWSNQIGSTDAYGFTPVVHDGVVYAASPKGNVVAVQLNTGKTLWSHNFKEPLVSGVGTDGNTVIVGNKKGAIVALNAHTGQVLWTQVAPTMVSTPALVADGVVVVRSDDFRVRAFNSQTGELLWGYERDYPDLKVDNTSQMTLDGQTLIIGLAYGELLGLNLHNGQQEWVLNAAPAKGGTQIESVTDIVGQPLVMKNMLCTASYQSQLACYRLKNKVYQPAWQQNFSSAVGPVADDNDLYAVNIHGLIEKFNLQNGQSEWQNDILKNRQLAHPVLYKNSLVTADYQGYVHFINAQTGQLQARLSTGSSAPVYSPLLVTDLGVLVQNGNGQLLLIDKQ